MLLFRVILVGLFLFVLVLTRTTLAADDAGRCQQQKGRGHQQQNAEASKNGNHLSSVPDD